MESGDKVGFSKAAMRRARRLIKRMIEPLDRYTRPSPAEANRGERSQWYFQRCCSTAGGGPSHHLQPPWYNRAGVEKVMGFSTSEQEIFLRDVPHFRSAGRERDQVVKLWLDISRESRFERLKARREDPLKAMKTSPRRDVAQEVDDHSAARDEMLTRTHNAAAPWRCVVTDKQKVARLNIMRHVIHAIAPASIAKSVAKPDPAILFPFEIAAISDGRLNR